MGKRGIMQTAGSISLKTTHREMVFAYFHGVALIVASMGKPSLIERSIPKHRLKLYHGFKTAHNSHQMVGVATTRGAIVREYARLGVET